MANLLAGGVTRGLVGASSAMKTAGTAMGIYVQAKARKDDAAMERALGYATDSMGEAAKSTKEAKTALADNVKAAKEEEKAANAARLEQMRKESSEKKAETTAKPGEPNPQLPHSAKSAPPIAPSAATPQPQPSPPHADQTKEVSLSPSNGGLIQHNQSAIDMYV